MIRAPAAWRRAERGAPVVLGEDYFHRFLEHRARRAGAGARLEVIVPKGTSAESVSAVENLFAWLREKGIDVTVRCSADEG